jgi:DNA segregation ATPase FtsK/SpoIIIE, S-DNA-T family
MIQISMPHIIGSRYRTSSEADRNTNILMKALDLSTKAAVARLAIGRSLALGKLQDETIDAKGLEIPAQVLFTAQDILVWVGLIVTHAQQYSSSAINSSDAFRTAVRFHWHRGAALLMEDWLASDQDYDRFVETLVNRRACLPESTERVGPRSPTPSGGAEVTGDVMDGLLRALRDVGVAAEPRGVTRGIRVTRHKIRLLDVNQLDKLRRAGERISLALGLGDKTPTIAASDEAKTVFVDLPRRSETWTPVTFADLKSWSAIANHASRRLDVFVGVDAIGAPFTIDLEVAPHVLIGGATGMGKSVCVHSFILSLLLTNNPSTLQLVLIDPKQVEFSAYAACEFLYGKHVITDTNQAGDKLQELVDEMENRYLQFSKVNASNIQEAGTRGIQLPSIVIFIEELADLIVQNRNAEVLIVRLAQKARAAGIHLVLATQRPDAKTFSGLIRSNIPTRVALTVQKSTESTIILDETGAESLLGKGDMLVKVAGGSATRVHGVYTTRDDIQVTLSQLRGAVAV